MKRSFSVRAQAPRVVEPYYLLPKGMMNAFAVVYCGGVPSRPVFEVGGVQWRSIGEGHYGEYTLKDGRETDELVVYLLAQMQSARETENRVAQPVMMGWLNPMSFVVPENTKWIYDLRSMQMRPCQGTTMAQRQLKNMLRKPAPTPSPARRSPRQEVPGAPVAKRSRRQRQRRNLGDAFDEEAEREQNPMLIHDDMREDSDEMPFLVDDDEDEEGPEFLDIPQDAEERRYLVDLAIDALRGVAEYHLPDVPRGGAAQLGRNVRVRAHRQPEPPMEIDPEIIEAQNLFARALAGQMSGAAMPERAFNFGGRRIIPITIRSSRMVEEPPTESAHERIRRMQAALTVSETRIRQPGERDADCLVCANEYATEQNLADPDRVLRVVLDGCNHELCRNCSLAIDKCPVCRVEMSGTSTDQSSCADCMMHTATTTNSVVRMLPCQHLCLCRGCADARIIDANFLCPVCFENADNWQVVG